MPGRIFYNCALFNLPGPMALIVQKYGGTSVGTTERIKNVAKRVAKWKFAGHDVIVVVSAIAGETNRLIDLACEIQSNPDARELDVIASTGEQVTIGLLSMALKDIGVKARSYTGAQIPLLTDSSFTKARIVRIEDQNIRRDLQAGNVVVVAGFQGVDAQGNITTLGRGGSDTSGVAIAAALGADECQIYTDVDGVYTTDPRVAPGARRLQRITFEEMLEMASLGSKVLQIRSVEFAGKYRVRLRVLSSLTPPDLPIEEEAQSGTLITFEEDAEMEQALVSGIAFNRDEAKVTILGVPDKPGVAAAILKPIADANIEVDVIVQNVGKEGLTDFSFTVHRNEFKRTMDILAGVVKEIGARELIGDENICKLGLVGVGMRSHGGVASTMFQALADEGINIQMISTSEIKITVVIHEKYMELAVRVLHKAFGLDEQIQEQLT
jgi:aspartate kinase